MNNKKCPQCKNLIPTNAPTCLYCGRPNKFITKEYVNKKWNKNTCNKRSFLKNIYSKSLLFILIILIVSIIFKFS